MEISILEDHAVLDVNDELSFYYGYEFQWDMVLNKPYIYSEETGDNETEWCFVVKKNNNVITYIQASIFIVDGVSSYECDVMLLLGIGWWLNHTKRI